MLKPDDVKLLMRLVSEEIDREGEKKELEVVGDNHCFYRLVDLRNRLLVMAQPEVGEAAWNQFLRAFNRSE